MVTNTTVQKKKCICNKEELLKKITGEPPPLPIGEVNKIRLNLFTERNSDGTGYLILRGKDLHDRYKRRIKDLDITAIYLYIREIPRRITKVDLCYNQLTDRGFFNLLKRLLIKGRSSIIDLNIMNNNITYKSIEYLAQYAKYIKLKRLRINGNDLGTDSGKFLAQLLKENDTIEFLDLGETGQTLTSVAEIIAAFRNDNEGNTTVKVLDLSRVNPLFNRYSYETKWLAYHIEFLLERNSNVIELHLQKNQFIAHDMEYFVRGLRNNATLRYLNLGYNRIGDYGAELLAKYLSEAPQLIFLNIAGNGIHDIGAKALSYGLPYSNIRALDISQNKISNDGVMDLLYTIKKKVFLRYLNIWGNELKHTSCEIIQRMLMSGVLDQSTFDVKIYEVDEVFYAAYYPNPADRSKHFYYCELEYGYAQPIYHIQRNVLPEKRGKIFTKYM
ncbi:PREDICTED: leucine-rich repeat-containing protein 34-like [Papilio polytes]|uniref:leucine-rich repeat-containing protein 34-like n=1 Tax=Papilio polytes TaxID=76194 RepID=UPI00067633F7|nr:PREDICTED: leucine-rich repeat-containing protein 34-like [Papilio polytes]